MSNYRQIHSKIWSDPWFVELDADEKLVFIYLFSNDRVNVTGIYDVSTLVIANETGLDRRRVEEILVKFETDGKIKRDGTWLFVVNLFSYNAINISSPNMQTHISTTLKSIDRPILLEAWVIKYGHLFNIDCVHTVSDDRDTLSDRIDTVLDGIHTVSIPSDTMSDGIDTVSSTDTDTDTDTDTELETERSTPRSGVAAENANLPPNGGGADAPSSPNAPKPDITWPKNGDAGPLRAEPRVKSAQKRAKAVPRDPPPPAIQVYHANTQRFPAKSLWAEIDQAVGRDLPALERWGAIIHAWLGLGWSAGNVNGMLDFFRRNDTPPGNGRGHHASNSRRATQVGWAKSDGYTAEDIDRILDEREHELSKMPGGGVGSPPAQGGGP